MGASPSTLRSAVDAARSLGASSTELIAAVVTVCEGPDLLAEFPAPEPIRPDAVAALVGRVSGLTGFDDPHLLGALHEHLLDRSRRRTRGVHLTPPDVARRLVEVALDGMDTRPERVLDPTCGGATFLLAARDALGPGVELVGCDIDPVSAWAARLALARAGTTATVVEGDVLTSPRALDGPFDLVVGNPPFLPQLRAATARLEGERLRQRTRFGPLLGPYTDGAVAFFLDALERVRPGGRVSMIMPWSVVATRDTAQLRRHLLDVGQLVHLWIGGAGVFEGALVQVCALVVERGSPSASAIGRSAAVTFDRLDDHPFDERVGEGDWSGLIGGALGIPPVDDLVAGCSTLGERALVTAGFRDEYYAITAALREHDISASTGSTPPPGAVVSCGLIDPLDLMWGTRTARMAKANWHRPVVDLVKIADGRAAAWVAARMRPKVLVATQTRVVEVAVDETGGCVPLTPVVSVEPHAPEDVWAFAAALSSPIACAWAAARTAGTALSPGALKLAASDLRACPLPHPSTEFDMATDLAVALAAGPPVLDAWRNFGETITRAYGVDDPARVGALVDWWIGRIGLT